MAKVDLSSPSELIQALVQSDRRALARVLSMLENGSPRSEEILKGIFPYTGRALVVGFTGSSGAGKSTLVDQFAAQLVGQGKQVAILAVDPSSPFSGGAILGDRIRMSSASVTEQVFIRSMASRGALGGLAPRSAELIFALDAAGFDYILVETVGVGQGEVEIVRSCDTVCVVLVPGMGDGIQALKAGILEIADLFVINKSDYDGADRLERELIVLLGLGEPPTAYVPRIIKTVASEGRGIPELCTSIACHREWATGSGQADRQRERALREALLREVTTIFNADFRQAMEREPQFLAALSRLFGREADPHSLARDLLGRYLKAAMCD